VDRGEILGFLGPNGAGKSTTLKILTCYIVADSGKVSVDGHDVLEESFEVRKRIGYLPENTPLYSDMRVRDFLEFVCRVRGIPATQKASRMDNVIAVTGIERMLMKNIGHLSKGYRQRVGLAQALMHDPPILILDEPTSGLDPHQIIEIRELIRDLGKTKTIVFSSHILQEISAICTRIIIIKEGRVIADGSPEDLQASTAGGRIYRVRVQGPSEAVRGRLAALGSVASTELIRESGGFGEYHVKATDGKDLGPDIFRAAKDSGWTLSRLESISRSLEEMYLQLTEN
jgi:ABC-2 type transport system ATP-binding protein